MVHVLLAGNGILSGPHTADPDSGRSVCNHAGIPEGSGYNDGAIDTLTFYAPETTLHCVAGTLSWLLSDHLGSTTVTADGATGARTAELWYKPWGESRGTPFGATPTTYRFTGQREEAGIGLYFYNARYYDPSLGRFTQADTIVPSPGDPQSFNRYAYVGNRPTVYLDPTGNAACAAGDAACWQDEWHWKDRWYKAHGHTGGDWFGSPGAPDFEDEQILRETVGEAGVSIIGAWDFATQLVPMATGIVRFGNRLSGGLAQLRGLLGGGAKIRPGSCFGSPCALPPGTDTAHISNTVFDAAWLMHTVVHELAHIIDWHSHIQTGTITTYGQTAPVYRRFSSAWGEAPLTKYAAGIEVGVRPYPDAWDVWAEAVTVWVFGDSNSAGTFIPTYGAEDIKYLKIPASVLNTQMSRIQALLEGWW